MYVKFTYVCKSAHVNDALYKTKQTCRQAYVSKFEPPLDKTNKMTYAPSEDSDQPGHPQEETFDP